MAFKNDNSECKRMIRPLKARSDPIDEWIWNIVDIGSHTYDDTWIEEVISKNFKEVQKVRCFNVVNKVMWKGIPRNNAFSRDDPNRRPDLLKYAEGTAKANIGPMNADQQVTDKIILCHWETP